MLTTAASILVVLWALGLFVTVMRVPRTPVSTLALATILTAAFAVPVNGQFQCRSMEECDATVFADVGLQQELTAGALNALLGGVTSAALRFVRGEPVWDAFWQGAIGGGLTYAGKRVAVERFYGAGLVGRQVASVGGSVTRNAAAGRGALDELVLPAGPVRLYISDRGITPRLDLATLVTAGAFMLTYDARLDPGASLSAGALIFRGDSPMPGLTSAGAMVVWSDMPSTEGPRLMAHERVHILQYDQMFLSWGEELERWTARQAPAGLGGALDHFDFGVSVLGIGTGLSLALTYRARPWETEAYFLAQRAYPVSGGP